MLIIKIDYPKKLKWYNLYNNNNNNKHSNKFYLQEQTIMNPEVVLVVEIWQLVQLK
jgi:hypothetical protein